MSVHENRASGKHFELLFRAQCERLGYLVVKNDLSARHLRGGKVRLLKSQLDFLVITREGRCGLFDCKSFEGSYLTRSQLNDQQVERAYLYNEFNLPAGFIVWHRETNKIVYYKGELIVKIGSKARFDPSNGTPLGEIFRFDISIAMK